MAATDGSNKDIASAVDKAGEFGRNVASESQTVSATIEEQTAMMRDITDSSAALVELAQKLQDEVAKFHL